MPMPDMTPQCIATWGLGLLTVYLLAGPLSGGRLRIACYCRYLWTFFLMFAVGEWFGYRIAVWVLAAFSFVALREYFSLVDFRLQDRWAMLVAYLSIPFMTILIQADWYGFFIVSIPVYAFQVMPFLVAVGGGEKEGMIFSIGAIDFGLFLFVYSVGHIAYLAMLAAPLALLLILGVTLCDLVSHLLGRRLTSGPARYLLRYVAAALPTIGFLLLLAPWAGLTPPVALGVGLLIPFFVVAGDFTIAAVEADLGIDGEHIAPGQGRIIDSTRSYLFTAPVVFHYLRYFTELF
jgi:phosphatidate cytidylyltransferase